MDTVSLHKLQLEVSAPTVWSVPKVQPALLTIHLILRNGFGTAANQDALDENTIHYGDLAKRIRAQCQDKPTLEALFPLVETVYSDMALRKDGTCRLSRSMVVINLSQASMHGESCELVDIQDHERNGKSLPSGWQFRIKDIKIMLLIGLKNEERERKQPVVINLDLILDAEKDVSNESITRRNSALFNLERKLIEIIQDTTFGTLEALADFTATKLEDHILDEKLPCTQVHLNFSKPRVIDFAEGPSVDITRSLRGKRSERADGIFSSNRGAKPFILQPRLKIVKPYI